MDPLRIAIPGAAWISARAIDKPAQLTGHRLVAVTVRYRVRAEEFAEQSSVERVLDSYQALIEDPEVEAIYNSLPNCRHGAWNPRAISIGNYVLSERSSASNAVEAQAVGDALAGSAVTFMESFHYRCHPVMKRMLEEVLVHLLTGGRDTLPLLRYDVVAGPCDGGSVDEPRVILQDDHVHHDRCR